ncbi:7-keto-8-aminopelargonate synthetase [Filimonas lacunae]|uniref:7-keto-8-aminopelargonate synthetase n=1 Tax=Filimonas lacunae TaxID=477680 RepID=A0A173MM69_9BACT|nr:aminotransferase class I/II-fold pyridoxal phosphate-dependent enzyme [Filimonas lacunae]BAV08560.1 2-amino-3-ketobutyrate coenzyme A ligase [Filimonas lacunae]SIS57142.1 7-keto-8-aminopelargonate synthetase [Filimonas lacunae]
MLQTTGTPTRTIYVNGREYLFFSGYAYLGMHQVPAFTELVKEGIDRYGLSFPSSRISNTRLDLFAQMEQLLSVITGKEDTVCMASGFSAGTLAGSLLTEPVLAAPGTHPAVYKLTPSGLPYAIWTQAVQAQHAAVSIVADAIDIFTPALHSFDFLHHHPWLTVLVDDSHGIGITGEHGEGVSSRLPAKVPAVITYSLSKAFNLIGGAISCSKEQAAQLRQQPAYTASTSLSPAFMYAFIQGQDLYAAQRNQLHKNIALFIELIQSLPGIHYHQQLPMFVLPDTVHEQQLLDRGIVISSFAYPNATGKKIQRVVINALHTEADLHNLAGVLQKILA